MKYLWILLAILVCGCASTRSVRVNGNSVCFHATADRAEYLLLDFFCADKTRPSIRLEGVNYACNEFGTKFKVRMVQHSYDIEKGYNPPRNRLYLLADNGTPIEWMAGLWTVELIVEQGGVLRTALINFEIIEGSYSPLIHGPPN